MMNTEQEKRHRALEKLCPVTNTIKASIEIEIQKSDLLLTDEEITYRYALPAEAAIRRSIIEQIRGMSVEDF